MNQRQRRQHVHHAPKPPKNHVPGFNYRYTRYPKDEEATLSPSLGIPGYDPAPLQEDPRFPETMNLVTKEGYVQPPTVGLDSETSSFFDKVLSHGPKDGIVELTRSIDLAFQAWEDERSSEVVYRTDGLSKFLDARVESHKDQDPELKRFLERLAKDSMRLVTLADHVVVFRLPESSSGVGARQNKIADLLKDENHRVSALRAAWWIKLVFMKSFGGRGPSQSLLRAISVKACKDWTNSMTDYLVKSMYEMSELREPPKKKTMVGIGRQNIGGDSGGGSDRVGTFSSPKQLTKKIKVVEKKLGIWEYMSTLVHYHFEARLIDRSKFIERMLFTMGRMHSNLSPPGAGHLVRGPLPLCVCYLFVRQLLSYAPYMNEKHLREFWRLCSINLRMLYFTRAVKDPPPSSGYGKKAQTPPPNQEKLTILQDSAFIPYANLLQNAIEFIHDVTPEASFRKWEFRQSQDATPPLPSLNTEPPIHFPTPLSAATFSEEYRAKNTAHDESFSVRSGSASGRVRVRLSGQGAPRNNLSTFRYTQSPTPGTPPPIITTGLINSNSLGGTPSNYGGSTSTPSGGNSRPTSPAPFGRNSVTPPIGGIPTGTSGSTPVNSSEDNSWGQFEIISNTESLHSLLESAKKVSNRKK
mmetsp:Transcript_6974/g.11061  ORF Transcript_6974/g.11061 Transcript_6974/m.11061 type:complete len:639 (-) Transcript_6974:2226-4142(-)|eukprot:CAMPEP_0203769552 /NCGR_PEP_ID=MMETSP0099_2-20121227/2266_1 /ASSEMBLY_ACC=CAM_ASM_000209 /TAXON_ID=96639 /ORGANISM=" , Strain NY0313808BC1" /LENGTH=638 /DNA_ID=CAMNT_0050666485 /DNA_START=129 /DNA_END=2045 /DNA_ORIENTATION=+